MITVLGTFLQVRVRAVLGFSTRDRSTALKTRDGRKLEEESMLRRYCHHTGQKARRKNNVTSWCTCWILQLSVAVELSVYKKV